MNRLFATALLVAVVSAQVTPIAAPAGDPVASATGKSLITDSARNIVVTEKLIDGEVDDLVWVGPDRKVVFLLSDMLVLYRSTDDGKSWASCSSLLADAASEGASEKFALMPAVRKIIVSDADPSCLFFLGVNDVHWVTTNAGRTFTAVRHRPLHEVKLHPTNPKLLLASALSRSCSRSAPAAGDKACRKMLYRSSDFGASWLRITDYVVQFDWAHNLPDEQVQGIPEQRIFVSRFKDSIRKPKKVAQRFGFWDRAVNLVYSDDYFMSRPHRMVARGNRFLFTSKYLFVAQVKRHTEKEVELAISQDGGRTFMRGTLPFRMRQHSYTVLDTSEDSVFLHVNHDGEGSRWGHVYLSNSLGVNYTLSLPNNRRDANGKCDFEKVEGLEGIYLANYIDNVDELQEQAEADSTQEPRRRSGSSRGRRLVEKKTGKSSGKQSSGSSRSTRPRSAGRKRATPRVRTVISFDKGGLWSYLDAPKTTADGKSTRCTSAKCSLHLHGVTDMWGPFYSTETAVGLIMATGNIGSRLRRSADSVNTYLSRDGGLNWYEVRAGSHIYEFGNHGALIVMASDTHATDHIIYSWNEGLHWEKFVFSETAMLVENIIIEPSSKGQSFILYGVRPGETSDAGVLIHLDFSELHERACSGEDAPGADGSDFENWMPSDGRTGEADGCLMGHTVQYARRKRASECFIQEDFQRPRLVKNCECREEDWECDLGFERRMDGGPCVMVFNRTYFVPDDCPSGTTYRLTNGYRRVAGDTCEGGVDHSAEDVSCPHWTHRVSKGGWASVLVLLLLIGALGSIVYYNRTGKSPLAACGLGAASYASGFDRVGYHGVGSASASTEFGLEEDDEEDTAEELTFSTDYRPEPLPSRPAEGGPVPLLSAPRSAGEAEV